MMVKRFCSTGMRNHVMPMLGARLGPFYSARYITRLRTMRSGPFKGTEVEVIVLVVLTDIHKTLLPSRPLPARSMWRYPDN